MPTPPVAPVTMTGPPDGVSPLRSSSITDRAAVKPAVPIAMASGGVSPGGIGTTQSPGTRTYLRKAAVVCDPEVVAGDEHAFARGKASVGGRRDGARHVDASDEGKTSHDFSRPGRRQRVLVVDARVGGLDRDGALAEIVQCKRNHATADCAALLENPECFELVTTIVAPVDSASCRRVFVVGVVKVRLKPDPTYRTSITFHLRLHLRPRLPGLLDRPLILDGGDVAGIAIEDHGLQHPAHDLAAARFRQHA